MIPERCSLNSSIALPVHRWSGRSLKCSCPPEKCHWAREKQLVAKLAHLQLEMKRVGESHAQEKRDLFYVTLTVGTILACSQRMIGSESPRLLCSEWEHVGGIG
uniref:Uncharacterized protein n=1 Tax=Timema genevievae TaxID=629358 RepID=A0A7R9PNV5_TIMGE|nr:unnamed protein product [Timema genevievae]